MHKTHDYQKGVRILERILTNPKASRIKKTLALIGLASLATRLVSSKGLAIREGV